MKKKANRGGAEGAETREGRGSMGLRRFEFRGAEAPEDLSALSALFSASLCALRVSAVNALFS